MNCGDGGEPLPPSLRSLPRLPPATPVRGDGTLGALLHVLRAAGLQACCLAVQGGWCCGERAGEGAGMG